MAFTRDWNESTPTENDQGNQIDNFIQQLKVDVSDRLKYFVYGFVNGETAYGDHFKMIRFREQAGLNAPGEGYLRLGCKAVEGKCELFFKDEDEHEKQVTSGGKLNVAADEAVLLTGDQTITGNKTFAQVTASGNLDIGDYEFRAKVLESDVATGTAPIKAASTTKVANLNADAVDGLHVEKYDSGWFYIALNTTYTKAHGLGGTPDLVEVLFSDTVDGSGDVVRIGNADYGASGVANPQSNVCDIDATNIKIRTGASYVADYLDAAGNVQAKTFGYAKILGLRFF